MKNLLTCLKDYKRKKIIYTFFTLNLLSNPPSPIGQWAKEILSRDEAVAKPFRIKTMFVNWHEKQKYKQRKDQVTQTSQNSLCSL